jgi:hypothetical protein
MNDVLISMAVGVAAIGALALVLWLSYITLPWSGYCWAAVMFLGLAAGIGSDIRSGKGPR